MLARIAVCTALAALAMGTTGTAAHAVQPAPAAAPTPTAAATYSDVSAVLVRLTTVDTAPGALAEVDDARGRTALLTRCPAE